MAKRPGTGNEHKRIVLAEAVTQALAARRYADAMAAILGLIALEPCEPRWHQKYGEVLRTLGRNREAAAAYRRAARRYEALALPVRASAALRVADSLDGAESSASGPQLTSDRVPTQAGLRSAERVTESVTESVTVRPPKP